MQSTKHAIIVCRILEENRSKIREKVSYEGNTLAKNEKSLPSGFLHHLSEAHQADRRRVASMLRDGSEQFLKRIVVIGETRIWNFAVLKSQLSQRAYSESHR